MTENESVNNDKPQTESSTPSKKRSPEEIREEIIEVLQTIYDPEIPIDIWNLGLIYRLEVSEDGEVDIDMTVTAPGCPVIEALQREVAAKVGQVEGVTSGTVRVVWRPPWTPDRATPEGKSALAAMGVPVNID